MWIHISKIAKTIIFSTQTDVETFHKLFFCKAIHNYCRKHQKFTKFIILHNRTQIGEKFSPIVKKKKKLAFLKCHSNCSSNKCKLLTHKNSQRQQLTAHTSIMKRITVSITNTHLSPSNALLCQLGSQTHKLLKQIKPAYIANYNIDRYNGSFFSYKKQCLH